jgi:hypothetical protein
VSEDNKKLEIFFSVNSKKLLKIQKNSLNSGKPINGRGKKKLKI